VNCRIISTEWSSDNNYRFYTPSNLPKKVAAVYKDSLEKLADLHKQIQKELNQKTKNQSLDKSLESTIPLSALVTIKISAQTAGILSLVDHLRTNPSSEVRWIAEQIQTAASRLRPDEFKTLKNVEQNASEEKINSLYQIAAKNLGALNSKDTEAISLEEVWPKNEFSLLADALYSYSVSSRADLVAELEEWAYDKKKEALTAALKSENSTVLSEARYRWNLIADFITFNNLFQSLNIQDVQAQPGTPRYGYDVPAEIEVTGLDELYIECFEESVKLFSVLSNNNLENIAVYALLAGHKNRWQFFTSANDLITVEKDREKNKNDINSILASMIEKVSEHHPLIADYANIPTVLAPEPEEKPTIKKPQLLKKPSLHRRHRSRKPKK
jgi:hypothetical protein